MNIILLEKIDVCMKINFTVLLVLYSYNKIPRVVIRLLASTCTEWLALKCICCFGHMMEFPGSQRVIKQDKIKPFTS